MRETFLWRSSVRICLLIEWHIESHSYSIFYLRSLKKENGPIKARLHKVRLDTKAKTKLASYLLKVHIYD